MPQKKSVRRTNNSYPFIGHTQVTRINGTYNPSSSAGKNSVYDTLLEKFDYSRFETKIPNHENRKQK